MTPILAFSQTSGSSQLLSLVGQAKRTRSPGFIYHIQENSVETGNLTVDENVPGPDAVVPPDNESDPAFELEIRIVLQDSAQVHPHEFPCECWSFTHSFTRL